MNVRHNPTAVIVQQGKLLDYIDGLSQRNETPHAPPLPITYAPTVPDAAAAAQAIAGPAK